MKATTKFIKIEDFPIEVTLNGTLGEFQKLVGHLDKNWAEPMRTFMNEIHDQVNIAEKQIAKDFELPNSVNK